MNGYEGVWEDFASRRRLEFGGHQDPSWAGDHALSASFVVPVDVEPFRERLEPLRGALSPFPFVSLHPDHLAHVTLLLLGFPVERPDGEGEISRARLEELEERARAAVARLPPFGVELRNLNAFPGAAFLEVHDGGKLSELREALGEGCDLEVPSGPPHLTLAYFQAPDGTPAPGELVEAIRGYRGWRVGEMTVDAVELTTLDLHREHPEPETLASLPLSG